MTPDTCGVTVTLAPDVTVPSASMITGMSACRDVATPTVLGGAPRPLAPRGPPRPPRAPAAAAPAAFGTGCGRCVRYQASAAIATNVTTAIVLPTHRRRRTPAGGSPVGGVVRDAGFGWSMRASCWRIVRGEPAARARGPHPRGGRCSNLCFEWLVPRDQAAARRR